MYGRTKTARLLQLPPGRGYRHCGPCKLERSTAHLERMITTVRTKNDRIIQRPLTPYIQMVNMCDGQHIERKLALNRKLKTYFLPQRRMVKGLSHPRKNAWRVKVQKIGRRRVFYSEVGSITSSATAAGQNIKSSAGMHVTEPRKKNLSRP